ncbi:MAG: zinc ribbon domain-containing protein [Gemmatimonadota bacterium]|jgi:putative FmdB family regulatory protein
MPTYEYRCPKGHEFEVFQRISDEPGATCPECGAPAQRQISAGAGFLFKGDGFYITDYRSQEYKKKASAEKGGDAGSGGGDKKASDAPSKDASSSSSSKTDS